MKNLEQILFSLFIITIISSLPAKADDYKQKPSYFPESTIQFIEKDFSNLTLLDTTALLDYDYKEILKKDPVGNGEFKEVKNEEIIKYLDFVYVKSILSLLVELDLNVEDAEIKEKLLFKIRTELEKKPISKKDLLFTYNYWNIDKVN